jgi:enoyl-CoA hydratase/carnithine racemase
MIDVIEISNPTKRNALDATLCRALIERLARLEASGARAAVLAGDPAGRAFCAGFDLGALEDLAAADRAFSSLIDAVAACRVPLVAALEGAAIGGGCELAATCDLRVAHPAVKLAMPPAKLGIVYPARGLARFAALCGESRARQLFLAARTVEAEEAHRWGLVDFLVPPAEVRPRAEALAAEIAALDPTAVQAMRRLFEQRLRPIER